MCVCAVYVRVFIMFVKNSFFRELISTNYRFASQTHTRLSTKKKNITRTEELFVRIVFFLRVYKKYTSFT